MCLLASSLGASYYILGESWMMGVNRQVTKPGEKIQKIGEQTMVLLC